MYLYSLTNLPPLTNTSSEYLIH